MVVKSYVNEYGQLSRMGLNTSNSNLLSMRFWSLKSSLKSMNEINTFSFMYKLQDNDPVESISKCLQTYNR